MTQHMLSMESDYKSMNNILNNYKAFMEDAARNYEWTEDELARWAESLGNGQQNSASSASSSSNSSANSESASSSSASNSSASASASESSSSESAGASAAPAAPAADDGVNTGAGHNYDAANYQGYVQNHGGNCYSFVNQVLTDQGRGSLEGCWAGSVAYLKGRETISGGQFIVSGGQYPSGDDIKNIFANAQTGDVVQMRWAYQAGSTSPHTAIISSIDENGVTFLHSHISGSNVKNSTYSWDELAKRYSNAGNGGGASIYRF